MAIKQNQSQPEVKRQLGRKKKQSQEYFDLICVELLDVKSIHDKSSSLYSIIDYGYLQLMEIPGKRLRPTFIWVTTSDVMIDNFEKWLTNFNTDIQIETTTFANTDTQIMDLRHHLSLARQMAKFALIHVADMQLHDWGVAAEK